MASTRTGFIIQVYTAGPRALGRLMGINSYMSLKRRGYLLDKYSD